jgi:LAO/AO transport system kinase
MHQPPQPAAAPLPPLSALAQGRKRDVAYVLSAIEARGLSPDVCALLDDAYGAPKAHVIGLTGPPGVGKSTLIDALLRHWRGAGLRAGVLAVDPSSQRSGGALLGDRIRMRTDPEDAGVFVRSLAARGRLGGLADHAFAATVLMRAIYDRVVVETVGVGQSEADIASVADTVVLGVQPGSGDTLQFMKAGVMEIPHVAVVTKADLGASARTALADMKGALSLGASSPSAWQVPCLTLSATAGEGLAGLLEALQAHHEWLGSEGMSASRRAQALDWLKAEIRHRYGSEGLAAAADQLHLPVGSGPFALAREVIDGLRVVRKA